MMSFHSNALENYFVQKEEYTDKDTGLSLTLSVFVDETSPVTRPLRAGESFDFTTDDECEPTPYNAAPGARAVIVYVVGSCMPRIGTEDDLPILRDLLREGYIVAVADFHGAAAAVCPAIDRTLQKIRVEMSTGAHLGDLVTLGGENYVLPAGYRIKRGIPYFDLLLHGSLGTAECIVDIWNRDLRVSRFADTVLHYRDGREVKVADAAASTLADCIKANGDPLDTRLYLDIIYPSRPEQKVPVMILESSTETRPAFWMMPTRPHMTGFLMRGYAGAIVDYAYVPTCRNDHYGYHYTGFMATQDYGLSYYNGVKSSTAAVRCLRYLADKYPEKYPLRKDAFGAFGHSKSGYCGILANEHPEKLTEQAFFTGHRGETNPNISQPFLTYQDGSPIPSGIELVYPSTGCSWEACLDGGKNLAPTFSSAGKNDGTYIEFYRHQCDVARLFDTPFLSFAMEGVGHDIIGGRDEATDTDLYRTFFDFCDSHLLSGTPHLVFVTPKDGTELAATCAEITLRFTAPIPEDEILRAVKITSSKNGEKMDAALTSAFGKTLWTLRVADLVPGETYTVKVPSGIRSVNGKATPSGKAVTFRVKRGAILAPMAQEFGNGVLRFPPFTPEKGQKVLLRLSGSRAGRATLYGVLSDRRDETYLMPISLGNSAEGTFDITDYALAQAQNGMTFRIAEERKKEEVLFKSDFSAPYATADFLSAHGQASRCFTETADGKRALALTGPSTVGDLRRNFSERAEFQAKTLLKRTPLDSSDIGRHFRVTFTFHSPDPLIPRYLAAGIGYGKRSADFRYNDPNDRTFRLLYGIGDGERHTVSFDYVIDNPDYVKEEIDKRVFYLDFDGGTLLLDALSVVEITEPVELCLNGAPGFSSAALVFPDSEAVKLEKAVGDDILTSEFLCYVDDTFDDGRVTPKEFGYRITSAHDAKRIDESPSQTHALHFLLSGGGTVAVGERTFQIGQGDAVWIPAGVPSSFTPTKFTEQRTLTVRFAGISAQETIEMLGFSAKNPVRHEESLTEVKTAFAKVYDARRNPAEFFLTANSALYAVFALLAASSPFIIPKKKNAATAKAMQEIIHANFAMKDFTVGSLTAAIHTNETSLRRIFREEFGVSPVAYLVDLRLDTAAKILCNKDASIKELCDATGFREEAHFMRSFKKKFGMTVTTYRKEKEKENNLK